MSFAEIEAELEKLSVEDLRRLALKSWEKFVTKESGRGTANECHEDDPRLLAALDDAIERADTGQHEGHSATEVRARLSQWTSR